MKQNCGEAKHCGREPGGEKMNELGVCTAAIDADRDGQHSGRNGGRKCWAVAGTFCGGNKQGTFAEKRMTCMSCDFFQLVQEEEGASFHLE